MVQRAQCSSQALKAEIFEVLLLARGFRSIPKFHKSGMFARIFYVTSAFAFGFSCAASMHVCAKHGKRRQQAFLVQCPDTGEWFCKPPDECKLFTNIGRHSWEKKAYENPLNPADLLTAVKQATSAPTKFTDAFSPNQKSKIEVSTLVSCDSSVITSWADEVDREFPFPENELPPAFPASPYTPDQDPGAQKAPYRDRKDHKVRRGPEGRLHPERQAAPADLAERVRFLEGELTSTKKELRKTKEDMGRLARNEKALELQVRELCTQVMLLRRQHNQSDICGRPAGEEPHSAPAKPAVPHSLQYQGFPGPRLDSGTTAFSPLSPENDDYQQQRTAPAIENACSLPLDSARSTQESARSTQHVDSSRSAQSVPVDCSKTNLNFNGNMLRLTHPLDKSRLLLSEASRAQFLDSREADSARTVVLSTRSSNFSATSGTGASYCSDVGDS